MLTTVPALFRNLSFIILLSACTSAARNKQTPAGPQEAAAAEQPVISGQQPRSMMDLPQTQYGGFVLAPGYYETTFKTYCLQPGTPDPSAGDAYLQGSITGYRKDIIESVLLNSRSKPEIDQRNIQLLLWSVVNSADFSKLSYSVQSDAMKLLTAKQIFELKGGVMGVIKTVSNTTGLFNSNKDMQRLFETGASSYEAFEKIAVLKEPAQIRRHGVKYDTWYKQDEGYYVRYFPVNYKQVRVQVYVPDGLVDSSGKKDSDHVVFDPTGKQAVPAFTNAQRLGIGGPLSDIVRVIIKVDKKPGEPRKVPEPVKRPERTKPATNPKA